MLTQEELASRAGVAARTIRDLESGRSRPQARTLRLLLDALGLDVAGPDAAGPEPEEDAPRGAPLAPDRTVPRELPRAPTVFVGRDEVVDGVVAAVESGSLLVALHGMAGVGKTSAAVWLAHRLAPRFPDGQIFVDLHGVRKADDPQPDPRGVLTRLLRSLGTDGQELPADLDELRARYRSVAAGRRMLLVLDNAKDADQVEALLPGTPSSLVLSTSRRDLSRLAGAYSVPLGALDLAEAVTMLRAEVGDRITGQDAVAVAERCGCLPLALGLAAARLRSRPQWTAKDLLARLSDDDHLLSELDLRHGGVAAALNASYTELDGDHRRVFRRMSLVPGDDVDALAAAALSELKQQRTTWILEALVDVHLVESRSPGRYRLHDLVRVYATQLAAAEEPEADRDRVLARLVDVYLHFAYRAAHQISATTVRVLTEGMAKYDLGLPGFVDKAAALAWFRAERANLAAAVTASWRSGNLEAAWHLATAFGAFRLADRDYEEYLRINDAALEISRDLGNTAYEAVTLADRGRHLLVEGRCGEAITCLEQAVARYRDLGDDAAAAMALRTMGIAHRQSGRFAQALDVYGAALVVADAAGEPLARVVVRANMVAPLLRLGRLADAERCLDETERLLEEGDEYNRLRIDSYRGTLAREKGDAVGASVVHSACLDRCRQLGFRAGLGPVLVELGTDLTLMGRGAEAAAYVAQALEDAEELGYPALVRTALVDLGRARLVTGELDEAAEHLERAAVLAESHEDGYELARARHGLADVWRARGDTAQERQHLRHAAEAYAACGVPEAEEVERRLG
ncbi:putative ATPase [Promicromonospora thailandica]|uniref:ATPase n=2 Tax=Promicromonospora thailandica TaxID=765201 RepID=A0A9X2G6H0_9MICO|nr:putative ATPase [Promicromonospora thailandica]